MAWWSSSTFRTIATSGAYLWKLRSLSSASATKISPLPWWALEPGASRSPPMAYDGSRPSAHSATASIEVVVVLPCVPATAIGRVPVHQRGRARPSGAPPGCRARAPPPAPGCPRGWRWRRRRWWRPARGARRRGRCARSRPARAAPPPSSESFASLPATRAPRWARIFAMPDIPAPPIPMKCGRSSAWEAVPAGAHARSPLVLVLLSARSRAPRGPPAAHPCRGHGAGCQSSVRLLREQLQHRYPHLVPGPRGPVAVEELLHEVRGGQHDHLVGAGLLHHRPAARSSGCRWTLAHGLAARRRAAPSGSGPAPARPAGAPGRPPGASRSWAALSSSPRATSSMARSSRSWSPRGCMRTTKETGRHRAGVVTIPRRRVERLLDHQYGREHGRVLLFSRDVGPAGASPAQWTPGFSGGNRLPRPCVVCPVPQGAVRAGPHPAGRRPTARAVGAVTDTILPRRGPGYPGPSAAHRGTRPCERRAIGAIRVRRPRPP